MIPLHRSRRQRRRRRQIATAIGAGLLMLAIGAADPIVQLASLL